MPNGKQNQLPTLDSSGPVDEISLARLLNILWRWKLIILLVTFVGFGAGIVYGLVTTPLFRAKAQVRPGITSFSEGGGPVREWLLKDIVSWFRRQLYWEEMKNEPRWDRYRGAPIIRAEFIPRGPQNRQGGNVITLDTLSPDPLEAVAILESAIESFIRQAAAETLSSTLFLTEAGIEVRMGGIRDDLEQLKAEKERLDLDIAEAKRRLGMVDLERKLIELDIAKLTASNEFHQRTLKVTEAEIERSLASLAEAQNVLAQSKASGSVNPAREDSLLASLSRDELTQWLLTNIAQTRTIQTGEMILRAQQLGQYVYRTRVKVDSLQYRINLENLEIDKLEGKRDLDLEKKRFDIEQTIAKLQIQRDRDLEHRRNQLTQDLTGLEVQLGVLSPLEKIGRIAVSSHPVRPRKLRATTILTILAFLSSIFLVLALEYYSRNKKVITAKSRD